MTQKEFESKQAEVSDTLLIETIETKLSKLCATGGKSLSMSVPPQTSDLDMAICELIRRYKQLIITEVSNRRELLIAFAGYMDGLSGFMPMPFNEKKVDDFLKSN